MLRLNFVQRNAIVAPANVLLIFPVENTPEFYYYNGTMQTPASLTGDVTTGLGITTTSATNAANSAKVADNSLTADDIAANAITASELAGPGGTLSARRKHYGMYY